MENIDELYNGISKDKLGQYITAHDARVYTSKDLIDIAIRRLQSKPVISDGVVLHLTFFKRLFTAKVVGNFLQKEYSALISETAEKVKFCIPEGTLLAKDIRLLIITPSKKSVHAWTLDNKIYPILQSANPNLNVVADDIRNINITFSDKAKVAISHNKNSLKALSDIRFVLSEISDVQLNTTKDNTTAVLEKIKELPKNDERLILLKEMAPDIIDDIALIFTDLDLYWG